MKNGLTVVADRTADVAKAIKLATSKRVLVGVPEDKGPRKKGAINNAALLYIHDHGAPEAGIPARPSMQPGLKSVEGKIDERMKAVGVAAFDGRSEAIERGFSAVGLIAANGIKTKINSNIPPPLKPATLAARRRRGVSRTNTLVDTAQMRNAVTFVIRETKP